jgi:DNA-binding NarL/FixJ family response regulator
LIQTIRAVHSGRRATLHAIGSRLAERMTRTELTARELEVLKLMAKAAVNKKSAARWGSPPHFNAAFFLWINSGTYNLE